MSKRGEKSQSPKKRIERVNELLKHELGVIVLREGDLPEGVLVTLTRVESAANLQQARVYISVMPEGRREEVMSALQENVYDIQQILNNRLRMRPVPKIRWVQETEIAQAQRIEEILEEIKKR